MRTGRKGKRLLAAAMAAFLLSSGAAPAGISPGRVLAEEAYEFGADLAEPYDFAKEKEAYHGDFDADNMIENGDFATNEKAPWEEFGGANNATVSGYKLRFNDIDSSGIADYSMAIRIMDILKAGTYQISLKAESTVTRKILIGNLDGAPGAYVLAEVQAGKVNEIEVTVKSSMQSSLWISVAGYTQGQNGNTREEMVGAGKHSINLWGISMIDLSNIDVENDDTDDMEYAPASVNVDVDRTQATLTFPAVKQAVSYKLYRRELSDGAETETLINEIAAEEGKAQYTCSITGLTEGTTYTFVLETCFPEGVEVPENANRIVRTVTTESGSGGGGGGSGITMGYPYASEAADNGNQQEVYQIPEANLDSITMQAPSKVKAKTADRTASVTIPDTLTEILEKNAVTYQVTYKSSNNKVLRVNRKTGRIRAKKAGKVTVKATVAFSNGQSRVLKKTVKVK